MLPIYVSPGAAVLSSTLFPTTEICAHARTGVDTLDSATEIATKARKFAWQAGISFLVESLRVVHQRQRHRAGRYGNDSGGDGGGELVLDGPRLGNGVGDVADYV